MADSESSTRLAVAVCAALFLCPELALAGPQDPAAAQALFEAGQKAMSAGDLATACAKFADSQRAEPAPGTLFFLADCEEKRGQLATAWAHFTELEQKLPAADARRPTVTQRVSSLGPRVPKLTIHLAKGAPADVVVTRDGVIVGPAALESAIPVDPGPHTIVVEARGRKPTRTIVDVNGMAVEVTVAVGAIEDRARSTTGGVQVPIGITTGSVGVAAMVAGIVVGVVAKGDYDESDTHCDDNDFCDDEGLRIRDDARGMGTAGTVVFIVGAVAAATGIVVWLTAPHQEGGLASGTWAVGFAPAGLAVQRTW